MGLGDLAVRERRVGRRLPRGLVLAPRRVPARSRRSALSLRRRFCGGRFAVRARPAAARARSQRAEREPGALRRGLAGEPRLAAGRRLRRTPRRALALRRARPDVVQRVHLVGLRERRRAVHRRLRRRLADHEQPRDPPLVPAPIALGRGGDAAVADVRAAARRLRPHAHAARTRSQRDRALRDREHALHGRGQRREPRAAADAPQLPQRSPLRRIRDHDEPGAAPPADRSRSPERRAT